MISVIIPTYKSPEMLDLCLKSAIQGQTKQNKDKDAFINGIFISSELELHKEKTNIVGCFLGQGLPDLRLPCEIFITKCQIQTPRPSWFLHYSKN